MVLPRTSTTKFTTCIPRSTWRRCQREIERNDLIGRVLEISDHLHMAEENICLSVINVKIWRN